MFFRGFDFDELVSAERRSPNSRAARDGGEVERSYRVYSRDAPPLTSPQLDDAKAAVVGWSVLFSEAVTVGGRANTRRWISRATPHAVTPVSAGEQNPSAGVPWLYASSIEECVPATGFVRDSVGPLAPMPTSRDGYFMRVLYKNFPYQHREDHQMLPAGDVDNPLSAGWAAPAGGDGVLMPDGTPAPARPDEGSALAAGWLSGPSRYVVKRVRDKGRFITLPQGAVKFVPELGEAAVVGGNVVVNGLPFYQPMSGITYHWVQVPVDAVPVNAIDYNRRRVNRDTFDGYRPYTLRFTGFDYEGPYQSGVGNAWYVDVRYEFDYMPNYDPVSGEYRGHNSFPRVAADGPHAGKFRYSYYTTDGLALAGDFTNNVFPINGVFAALFRPDQSGPDLGVVTRYA